MTTIQIKTVESYENPQISWLHGKPCILVTCSYDQDLVESIKALPKTQRAWDSPSWVILLDDPQQVASQQTNLEFIQEVVADCAERRGWKYVDLVNKTKEEAKEELRKTASELLEEHIQAMVEVIPKLPYRCLKLCRWGSHRIEFQLEYHIDQELFKELSAASAAFYKSRAMASFDFKMSIGFTFIVSNDYRILEALRSWGLTRFLNFYTLVKREEVETGALILAALDGEVFLGLPTSQVDMAEQNYSSDSWNVWLDSETKEAYWVEPRERLINSWLNDQDSSRISYFGGAFGVVTQVTSKLPEIIELFCLEEWFAEHCEQLLSSKTLIGGKSLGDRWHIWGWTHPADNLISHLSKFPKKYGGDYLTDLIGAKLVEESIQAIGALKSEAIATAKASDLERIDQLAGTKIRRECKSKPDFISYAARLGVETKKSWTIDRVIAEIVKDVERCKKITGFVD